MWQCSSCEYVNDDWDESCLRCGVDRVTSEAERAAMQQRQQSEAVAEEKPQLSELEQRILESAKAAQQQQEAQRQHEAARVEAEARRAEQQAATQSEVDRALAAEIARGNDRQEADSKPPKRNELAPVLIIAICLIGLCAVGYIAWSRGLIQLPQKQEQSALEFETLGFETRPAYPKNDFLKGLLEDDSRDAKRMRSQSMFLYDSQAALRAIREEITASDDQQRINELLDTTSTLGKLLNDNYSSFEEKFAPGISGNTGDLLTGLREEYVARGNQIMAILQVGYLKLDEPEHTAFLLSDSMPQNFSRYGKVDASAYTEQWNAIREMRHQQELDLQYADYIRELDDWYATLATLHSEVDKVIRSLGEVSSNRGRLNPAAVKLVVLLDNYATKIEGLNTDYETWLEEQPQTDSDSVNELIGRFRSLARDDHLHCFTEIYRRYVEDRYAELEQYDNLLAHYEYAQTWWPQSAQDYEAIYTTYETRWKERWVE